MLAARRSTGSASDPSEPRKISNKGAAAAGGCRVSRERLSSRRVSTADSGFAAPWRRVCGIPARDASMTEARGCASPPSVRRASAASDRLLRTAAKLSRVVERPSQGGVVGRPNSARQRAGAAGGQRFSLSRWSRRIQSRTTAGIFLEFVGGIQRVAPGPDRGRRTGRWPANSNRSWNRLSIGVAQKFDPYRFQFDPLRAGFWR